MKDKRGKQEFFSLAPAHTHSPFRTLIKEKELRQERVAEETHRDVGETSTCNKERYVVPR